MRPRGAAAAEPEGRRAGQPSPRAPCRCPDLPPARPGPATRPRCGPHAGLPPLETTDHLRILPQKLQGNFVPPVPRLSRLLPFLFPVFLRNLQDTGLGKAWPGQARGAVGWGVGEGAPVPLV